MSDETEPTLRDVLTDLRALCTRMDDLERSVTEVLQDGSRMFEPPARGR